MILDMDDVRRKIAVAQTAKHPPIFNCATVETLLRKIDRLTKVAEAATVAITRHDFDAQIPGTPIHALKDALAAAGLIAPVGMLKDAKPLILYFANDEDRAGFVEIAASCFSNPVEMDVP